MTKSAYLADQIETAEAMIESIEIDLAEADPGLEPALRATQDLYRTLLAGLRSLNP